MCYLCLPLWRSRGDQRLQLDQVEGLAGFHDAVGDRLSRLFADLWVVQPSSLMPEVGDFGGGWVYRSASYRSGQRSSHFGG